MRNLRELLLTLTLLFFLGGCTATTMPRYKTGSPVAERKKPEEKRKAVNKTETRLKEGDILDQQWVLYDVIKVLVNTPYRWGGTTPGKGMDCSGLTFYALREKMGYKIPRTAKEQYKIGKKIPSSKMRFGDLVFFSKEVRSRNVAHVGIYVNNDKFLHASVSKGVTVSNMRKPYWEKRLIGVKRILN